MPNNESIRAAELCSDLGYKSLGEMAVLALSFLPLSLFLSKLVPKFLIYGLFYGVRQTDTKVRVEKEIYKKSQEKNKTLKRKTLMGSSPSKH